MVLASCLYRKLIWHVMYFLFQRRSHKQEPLYLYPRAITIITVSTITVICQVYIAIKYNHYYNSMLTLMHN
jgi:hypothetical protein